MDVLLGSLEALAVRLHHLPAIVFGALPQAVLFAVQVRSPWMRQSIPASHFSGSGLGEGNAPAADARLKERKRCDQLLQGGNDNAS
jgi:hypothetical protein